MGSIRTKPRVSSNCVLWTPVDRSLSWLPGWLPVPLSLAASCRFSGLASVTLTVRSASAYLVLRCGAVPPRGIGVPVNDYSADNGPSTRSIKPTAVCHTPLSEPTKEFVFPHRRASSRTACRSNSRPVSLPRSLSTIEDDTCQRYRHHKPFDYEAGDGRSLDTTIELWNDRWSSRYHCGNNCLPCRLIELDVTIFFPLYTIIIRFI